MNDIATPLPKRAWTVKEWCAETRFSKATVHRMINERRIASVKYGRLRRITTSPVDFLASLDRG